MKFLSRPSLYFACLISMGVSSCAQVSVPDARNVNIPTPISAEKRREAVNERPDSVMYLPLGADVLVPERISGQGLPEDKVGPFELRGETLAGALQLILADYDISIAFETEEGLKRKVTVANLKGSLNKVVNSVCSLADLYCSYEDGALVVKDKQTFAVTLPPLAGTDGADTYITDVMQGLNAVLGGESQPVSDPTTRTVIYSATQRTSQLAENYFQRLRANTAMIVFETYIWEVSLGAGNSTGVDWDKLASFGNLNTAIDVTGAVASDFTNPISIGLPTTGSTSPTEVLQFLSQFGAVKTISQPQITVLSGSEAELRVADTENYVSEITSTISGDQTATSVSTDSVDSGFTLTIDSSWDKSTVYANVNVSLTNVDQIDDFPFSTGAGGGSTTIQLPQTTERELTTQIRMRPGDSVLIAGLVREKDNFDSRGPGFMEPIIPDSRTAKSENLELVILLRPRVIVYTSGEDQRFQQNAKKAQQQISPKINTSLSRVAPVITSPVEASVVTPPAVMPVVAEPIQPVIAQPPVAAAPASPLVNSFNPETKNPYMPQASSGYVPSYSARNAVSKPIDIMPTAPASVPLARVQSYEAPQYSASPEPLLPTMAVPVAPRQDDSAAIEIYDLPEAIYQPPISNDQPLSSEVYNNTSSINVYEAYERSKNSYYAP